MKKFTFSKVALVFCALSANVALAQNGKLNKLEFGKAYSVDELKSNRDVIRCATVENEKFLQGKYPDRLSDEQFENWLRPLVESAKANKSINNGVITIPVVVHVIHAGEAYGTAPNITDAQVQSQITVMNNDFRKVPNTRGYNTNPVGADVMIQFALAKVDPNGNPTNGIDRVNLCQTSWVKADIESIVKPKTIWDPTKYMNMWSVKFGGTSSNLLGYAQFPANSTLTGITATNVAETDGVVANYATFGSSDYNDGTFILGAPYDKGRTMTHEVGHFLGLRHIWGDDADPLVCATDYCDDTPPAHQDNYSCATPIESCLAGVNEMTENYMDYTNDACMNIFTNDQKTRMTTVMNNSPRRVELKASNRDIAIPLFANDAELKAENVCTTNATTCGATTNTTFSFSLYNRGTSPLTSAVISYNIGTGATQTYNWTGNLAQDKYAIISISSTDNNAVSAQITSVNGTADQRASNNFATAGSGNFTTTVSNTSTLTFTLQPDFYGSETTWTLKNSAGTTLYSGGPYSDGVQNGGYIVSLPALVTQTWNLAPDCYEFTINDTDGDGIRFYGYYDIVDSANNTIIFEGATNFGYTQSKTFKILRTLGTKDVNTAVKSDIQLYPNPTTDILNVTKVSDKATYKMYNAAGQLVGNGTINNGKINVASLVKGVYMITVEDKGKEEFKSKFIKN